MRSPSWMLKNGRTAGAGVGRMRLGRLSSFWPFIYLLHLSFSTREAVSQPEYICRIMQISDMIGSLFNSVPATRSIFMKHSVTP